MPKAYTSPALQERQSLKRALSELYKSLKRLTT
jgi:hypothetical protein